MTDFCSCSQRLPLDGGTQYIIMTQLDRAFLLAAVRYFWLPLHFWLTSKIVPNVDFRRWGPEDAGGYCAKKNTLIKGIDGELQGCKGIVSPRYSVGLG